MFGIRAEILQGTAVALSCGAYALAMGTWLFRGGAGLQSSLLFSGYLALLLSAALSIIVNGYYGSGIYGIGFEFGTAGSFLLCMLTAHAASMMSSTHIRNAVIIFCCVLICSLMLAALVGETDSLFLPQPDATRGSSSFLVPYAAISGSISHAVIGTGPNSYSYVFDQMRPALFNYSAEWNARVTSAPSTVLTVVTTLGAVGLASLLYATILPLYALFSMRDIYSYISFALAFFPLVASYFFPVSSALFMLSAVGAGFLARVTSDNATFTMRSDLMRYFTGAVLMVLGIFIAFVGVRQLFAAHEDAAGKAIISRGSAQEAVALLKRADASWRSSEYMRDLARALIYRMNEIAGSGQKNSNDEMKKLANETLVAARGAVAEDGRDYLAWRDYLYVLAVLHAGGLPIDTDEAGQSVQKGINQATTRPDMYFIAAQLYMLEGDTKMALKMVNTAIDLKSDYADALAFRRQIFK